MKLTMSLGCLLLQIMLAAIPCCGAELRILTGEFPPLSYSENGLPSGPAVEIANRIQRILDSKIPIEMYPWARGYLQLERDSNTMLFSTTRTPERDQLFKWVGPFAEKRFVLFAKMGSPIRGAVLQDFVEYRVGVMNSSNNDEFLVKKGFKHITRVNVEQSNLKMLLLGRIDLWYTDVPQANYAMEQEGVADQLAEVYTVEVNRSYFAFNRNTSDSIVGAWNRAFNDLYKNGTIRQILTKYKLEELYPKARKVNSHAN